MHGRPDRSMRGIPPRDVYELEPLEPRLLLSGIPIDLGPTPDLMGFIQNKLNEYANELVVGHYTEEYDVTNDDVNLGGIFSIDHPAVIFDITVEALNPTPQWSGTVSLTAAGLTLDLGSLVNSTITDGGDD